MLARRAHQRGRPPDGARGMDGGSPPGRPAHPRQRTASGRDPAAPAGALPARGDAGRSSWPARAAARRASSPHGNVADPRGGDAPRRAAVRRGRLAPSPPALPAHQAPGAARPAASRRWKRPGSSSGASSSTRSAGCSKGSWPGMSAAHGSWRASSPGSFPAGSGFWPGTGAGRGSCRRGPGNHLGVAPCSSVPRAARRAPRDRGRYARPHGRGRARRAGLRRRGPGGIRARWRGGIGAGLRRQS